MKSQILKNTIPRELLFDLLNNICIKSDKYYILNKISYKKGNHSELIIPFLENLKQYYYESKQFYLTRKQNYNTFITIL